ncbi:DNA cytosine methyltransferase [Pseudomonas sp. P7759]|uniref:DNA cytosine methyltransferase n=1 Tax=Pseudomonas sp. P7759 TaxID=2738831 RepID=UPI0015A2CD5A|nr:DNA cytosine methyltransferase [Pseudomonas sp. P7759]NWC78220.1 DNA cytosine methyltransferase [Pseudomonas sp. P7759]
MGALYALELVFRRRYTVKIGVGEKQVPKLFSAKSSKTQEIQKKPTFVDIFAGCGGLSLGLMQAGWDGLFAIEHDKYAFETLNNNLIEKESGNKFSWPASLPKTAHSVYSILEDNTDFLKGYAGKVDMLVGGPPCQGFSSAGKRNISDPRNKLVEAYLEFVKVLQPKVLLIENVRGITSSFSDASDPEVKTNYANQIINSLSVDYNVSTKVLDTSSFGVPQRRQRFFIIAFRKNVARESLNPFFEIEQDRPQFLKLKTIGSIPVSSKQAISDLEIKKNGVAVSRDTAGFMEISYSGPLTSYQKLMNAGGISPLSDTRLARHRPEISDRFEKIIRLCHADGRLNVSLSAEIKASFGLKKSAIRVLDPSAPSPTITSMPDDLIHYSEPRTLTVRENARLQSFPDWFTFHGKYTSGGSLRRKEVPRFTQVANAVPPLAAEAIGLTIARLIESERDFNLVPEAVELKARRSILDIQEA